VNNTRTLALHKRTKHTKRTPAQTARFCCRC